MNKIIVSIIFFAFVLFSCKNDKTTEASTTEQKQDTTVFFQTALIFQQDIRDIDSVPYYIYKIETIDGKKDSTQINNATFKSLAASFLKPDITSKELKPNYKESIFEDQTTEGYTVSYRALDKELEVQSVDILLKDDGKTIKNIFIRKFFNYGDSSAIEQLTWKPQQRFQIIRSVQKPGNVESNHQTLVVWNQNS